MKKGKNRVIKSTIALLLAAIVATTAYLNPFSSEAAERFPGVEILVNKTTGEDPFTILEIVDDRQNASVGFYIKGAEPFGLDEEGYPVKFDDMISSMMDKDARTKYITSLTSRLAGKYYVSPEVNGELTATDYPLVYTPYEETYFLNGTDTSGWKTVRYEEKLTLQMNGSYQPIGADEVGDYVKNEDVYMPSQGGAYVENIGAFYLNEEPKNYTVTFTAITDTNKDTAEVVSAVEKYGSYLPVSEASTELFFYDGPTVGDVEGTTYYYVSSFQYVGETGTYGIRYRVGEDKYIPCPEGQVGTHAKNEDSYSYLGGGMGGYNFIPDNTKPLCAVEVDRFYYKGGFTNNNWFKEKVLLLDEEDLEVNGFPTVVKTLDLTEVDGNSFADVDMVVINGLDASKFQNSDDDIWTALATKVTEAKFPCVINSELMSSRTGTFYAQMQGYYNASDVDKNFVKGSVYWHTGPILNIDFGKQYTFEDAFAAGFEEVEDYIDEENDYRGLQSDVELIQKHLSQARAIEYVLGRQAARNIAVKETLTVLEIEPCADYFFVNEGNTTAYDKVRSIVGFEKKDMPDNRIYINKMTTAEFIGKIEDLNGKYDFIYIGMRTGLMNTDSNGKTEYNDTEMNGYVYTNIGDYVIASERIIGMMDTDYPTYTQNGIKLTASYPYYQDLYDYRAVMVNGKLRMDTKDETITVRDANNQKVNNQKVTLGNLGVYRYSGNDITKEKMNQLIDYITAGYPIILDEGFRTYDTKAKAYVLDDKKVDNSSYMYELFKGNGKTDTTKTTGIWGRSNLFFYNDISPDKGDSATKTQFQFYMKIPKLKIDFGLKPADAIAGQFMEPDAEGKNYLTYNFSISDEAAALPASTEYTATLYVDMNQDGKFSRLTEYIDDSIILNAQTGAVVESTKLVAGTNYVLKRQIPDGFRSIVPWKIEVNQTANKLIRQSETGYAGVRVEGTKEKIYILQIVSTRQTNGGNWNLASDSELTGTGGLLSQVNDFELIIDTISTKEYEEDWAGEYFYNLNMYDMLILGFDDAYQDFTLKESVDAIIQYINTGKSVLFTHDTTSLTNFLGTTLYDKSGNSKTVPVDGWRWGYLFNTWIRDLVGMDRYGITAESTRAILKQNQILNYDDPVEGQNVKNNFAIVADSGKDMAYVVGSGRTQTYPETHGYNYLTLNNSKEYGTQNHQEIKISTIETKKYNLDKSKTNVNSTGNNHNGELSNMVVTAVNEGQITKYPFELADEFGVAGTHSQYYQLDLTADKDKDQESDIVVWYCISDASGDKNMYNASPNDVRNNYYIYSIGNVFYTGVGHSTPKSKTQDVNQYEKKLFINTMVAAYSAQITNPEVSTLAEEHVDAQTATTVRLPIEYTINDAGNTTQEYLDSTPIEFYYTLNDSNFVSSAVGSANRKIMSVQYYLKSDSENAIEIPGIENGTLKGIDITNSITTKSQGADVTITNGKPEVKSGHAYTAYVNFADVQSYIGENDSASIYIVVSSTFNHYGVQKTQYGYNTIHLKKTNLFDLD